MEAIAEPPASTPHILAEVGLPYRITQSNAAEMAKRRWAAERERKTGNRSTEQIAENHKAEDDARAKELRTLRRQIEHLDELIEGATDAKDLQMFTNARWKQFETWRILSGIPMPGSRKPAADKATKRGPMPDPT